MSEANGQTETSTTAQASTTVVANGSGGEVGIKVAGPLSADNRTAIEAKEWLKDGSVDLEKVVGSYRSLESEFSKSIRLPGEAATADEWNAFYSKMGRPEKASDYALKLDASAVPEGFPYDEASAVEFRNWAHEAGLSPKQAQTLHDKFVASQAAGFTAQVAETGKRAETAHRDLVGKWGDAESEGYKRNVELASRASEQLGLTKALQSVGALSTQGEVLNADIFLALAKVGKELYAEDKMATNANGMVNNPWAAGKVNLTEQGRILRSDPKLAKSLMVGAGVNPAEFGL